MILQELKGYELTKAQPNTSEDFFNRSEVTYIHSGMERTLYVLYVRYFEEHLSEFTPFAGNPVFKVEEREVTFKEIVALACLLKQPGLVNRKRVYINTKEELGTYFDAETVQRVQQVVERMYGGTKPDLTQYMIMK